MQGFLRFLKTFHLLVLFLVLEIIAFSLFINQHSYQRASFLNSSNKLTAGVYDFFRGITQYLDLNSSNKELLIENLILHKQLMERKIPNPYQSFLHGDFKFLPARVINNSIHKRQNIFTINVGRIHGVKPDMAVISPSGVVGVTLAVSDNYSTAVSILNEKFKLSAKIRKNGYFGSLTWKAGDYRHAKLVEIPTHVEVQVGDTVVTSGYSSIFPEGYVIGQVSEIDIPAGSNFFEIKVKLAVDYKNLDYIYLIENLRRDELIRLKEVEKEVGND
jgi:rod shape-determining protein MreC